MAGLLATMKGVQDVTGDDLSTAIFWTSVIGLIISGMAVGFLVQPAGRALGLSGVATPAYEVSFGLCVADFLVLVAEAATG